MFYRARGAHTSGLDAIVQFGNQVEERGAPIQPKPKICNDDVHVDLGYLRESRGKLMPTRHDRQGSPRNTSLQNATKAERSCTDSVRPASAYMDARMRIVSALVAMTFAVGHENRPFLSGHLLGLRAFIGILGASWGILGASWGHLGV